MSNTLFITNITLPSNWIKSTICIQLTIWRVIAGPDHGGLAFRLAEAGYDVWMGRLTSTYILDLDLIWWIQSILIDKC